MHSDYLSQETLSKLASLAEQSGLSVDAYINQVLLADAPSSPQTNPLYERIFEQSQDAILVIDENNIYVDANPAALSLLGYTRAEFIGLSVFDVIAEDDARNQQVRDSWNNLGLARSIYRLRRKDGTFVYVDIVAVANVLENRHVAVIREAADFVRLMNDLHEIQLSFESFFSEIETPFFSIRVEEDGYYFHDASHAFVSALNSTRSDLVGQHLLDMTALPSKYLTMLVKYITQCFENGLPLRYETQLHSDTGRVLWKTRLVPMRNQDGRIYRILGICTDLSERRAYEKAQVEAMMLNSELEKASVLSKYKAQTIAMMIHEFQTPLSVINTSSYLLRRQLPEELPEKALHQLNQVEKQVQRLQQLVYRVIDLNQGTLLDNELRLEELNLYHLVQEIVEDITMYSPIGANIRVHCADESLMILTDTELMRQIITNLISNAVKYSDEQAPIDVHISINLKLLTLVVQDQGIGIPKADLNNIFDFFTRGQNVEQKQGIGIGLRVVYEATKRLGGEISIDSIEGEGTAVRVTFAADAVQQAS